MKIPHALAACALVVAASAWAMDQSPDGPPDATGAGASSSLGHTALPSGMAAGTSVNHDTVMQATTGFIAQTAQDDAAEMAAAQYASTNSRSPDIQQFASRILASKSRSTDQLRDLGAKLGINMPTYPTSDQLRTLNALHSESGARFDAAYAQFMANEHSSALARFKRAAQNSALDPAVRAFARNSLPSMQDTLRQANRLVASHATRSHTG